MTQRSCTETGRARKVNSDAVAVPGPDVVVFGARQDSGNFSGTEQSWAAFHLVTAGRGRLETSGASVALGPDTLIHVPSGQHCRAQEAACDPMTTYVIRYRPSLLLPRLTGQLRALGILPLDLRSANINQARVVRSVVQEMLFEQDARQEGWELVLRSRLIDLAVRTLRLVRRQGRSAPLVFESGNDSLERVAHYALRLKSQFFRHETLGEAAAAVGLSRRQFTELFRKVTGQSWLQYVLGLRLRYAAGLLLETDRAVTAVAFESGFEDLSHFHHSFRAAYDASPLAYREQRRVRLPGAGRPLPEPLPAGAAQPGFAYRGLKGWHWTPEQYLEEIPFLPGLKLNFLMNCYGSLFSRTATGEWRNDWWRPLAPAMQEAFARVMRAAEHWGITFCFACHPHLASDRPLDPAQPDDVDRFHAHFAWAQRQGVRWFCVSLDGISWGSEGPGATGLSHARLVNEILARMRTQDAAAQILCCPIAYWGDGTNPEHRAYLEALARLLHPEAYVFWTGDSVVTPRITRAAAESYRDIVRHRLFLWDNYPVNDGNRTLHLGPLRGRDRDLCEVIDGYLSNPMASQNQMNRLPLATCADYAYNPWAYDPARSIGQAIWRMSRTDAQRSVLKDLVEHYPGFIVAGGSSGSNPLRQKLGRLLAGTESPLRAAEFVGHLSDLNDRLVRLFPDQFPATKQTVAEDLAWMRRQLAGEA